MAIEPVCKVKRTLSIASCPSASNFVLKTETAKEKNCPGRPIVV